MTGFASESRGSRKVEPRAILIQPRRSRHHGPSELLRKARRNTQALAEGRADRRVAWPEGQPEFAAARQETRLRELEGAKRGLRRDVYRERPDLEGRDFRGQTGSAGRGR